MEENRKGKWQREKQTGRKSTGELEGGKWDALPLTLYYKNFLMCKVRIIL